MNGSAQIYFILLGVGANALWGAAFIVPYWLLDFSSEAIAISRYVVYGVVSVGVFLLVKSQASFLSSRKFIVANLISFCGNFGYYYFLALGVQKIGFVIPALIVGMLPVLVVLVSCAQRRATSLSGLLPGVGLMVCGILLINWTSLAGGENKLIQSNHVLGITSSLAALVLLTFYFVLNARFLKMNTKILSLQWTSLLGICAMLQSLVFAAFCYFSSDEQGLLQFLQLPADRLMAFFFGVFFLGVFVSYMAMWIWSIASRNISEILGARILCLEALFAMLFGYLIDSRPPTGLEVIGAAMVIGGGYFVKRQDE